MLSSKWVSWYPWPHRRPPIPLTVEVVELIGTVVARYHEEYEQAAAKHSLTGAQARVLGLLSLEPMPMRRLAQKLKCEPSNVTGIVDRLEARGLVERRPDPDDRRVKLAAATEEGAGDRRQLRESLDFAREPLAELSEEERTVLRDLLQADAGRADVVASRPLLLVEHPRPAAITGQVPRCTRSQGHWIAGLASAAWPGVRGRRRLRGRLRRVRRARRARLPGGRRFRAARGPARGGAGGRAADRPVRRPSASRKPLPPGPLPVPVRRGARGTRRRDGRFGHLVGTRRSHIVVRRLRGGLRLDARVLLHGGGRALVARILHGQLGQAQRARREHQADRAEQHLAATPLTAPASAPGACGATGADGGNADGPRARTPRRVRRRGPPRAHWG